MMARKSDLIEMIQAKLWRLGVKVNKEEISDFLDMIVNEVESEAYYSETIVTAELLPNQWLVEIPDNMLTVDKVYIDKEEAVLRPIEFVQPNGEIIDEI
jgi:hypothetical protein